MMMATMQISVVLQQLEYFYRLNDTYKHINESDNKFNN